jgi:serine/threonine-protein kinase
MTSERQQRLEQLFDVASRLEPGERASYLNDACGEDSDLRREVESLIRAEAGADALLGAAVGDAAREWAASPAFVGRRVGAYDLVKELGRGGMGAVYLGVRADDEYRKEVAVKLIRIGVDDPEMRRRFLLERQILANLDHPNIARLLDGGSTDDGLPYVVMEYVVGEPIDHYSDRLTLSIDARLRLFRQVCEAVQYAHRHLVVHRDLKPGNILVTSEGTPKLLDFGIAKLLDMPADGVATRTAVRLMTPEYASPEQVRGEPVTTASDVYSLGVLLYELLTGQRPYKKGRTAQDVERAVLEEEPERPALAVLSGEQVPDARDQRQPASERVSRNRGTTPARLARRLAGDLDNIVRMALRKEPGRRYASVEQLSEDVRRHLDGQPVLARRDSVGYRASKFVRRHPAGVFGSAAAVVLIAALTLFYTARLARERDRAQLEAAKAQQTASFLVDVFRSSDPTERRGLTLTAQEILTRGRERVERDLQAQPEVQATVLDAIGRVYQSLGVYDTAALLARQALDTRRRVLGEDHPDYATSLAHLSQIEFDRSDLDASERYAREAIARRRARFGQRDSAVAVSLANLASTLQSKGNLAAAETLYVEALAIRRELLGPLHRQTATSLNNLAALRDDQGQYAAADSLYRAALRIRKAILTPNDYDVAVSLNNVGRISELLGDLRGADTLYRQSLQIRRALFGDAHPSVLRVVNNLGGVYLRQGAYTAAESAYREVVAGWRRRGDAGMNLAVPLNNLAAALARQGKHRESIASLQEAMQLYTRQVGNDHPALAFIFNGLGVAYRALGDRAQSERAYAQAVALRRKHLPPGHALLATPLAGLGSLRMDAGDAQAAEPLFREALAILQDKTPNDSLAIADAKSDLAWALTALGQREAAEALLLAAQAVLRAAAGDADRRTVRALERLVRLYDGWGRAAAAKPFRELLSGASRD